MSSAKVRRRSVVPAVSASVEVNSPHLRECIEQAGVARLTDDGSEIGVVFAPIAFEQLRAEVEELELELRSWRSEVERIDDRLISDDQIARETERLVAGED